MGHIMISNCNFQSSLFRTSSTRKEGKTDLIIVHVHMQSKFKIIKRKIYLKVILPNIYFLKNSTLELIFLSLLPLFNRNWFTYLYFVTLEISLLIKILHSNRTPVYNIPLTPFPNWVYEQYDGNCLVEKAHNLLRKLRLFSQTQVVIPR